MGVAMADEIHHNYASSTVQHVSERRSICHI